MYVSFYTSLRKRSHLPSRLNSKKDVALRILIILVVFISSFFGNPLRVNGQVASKNNDIIRIGKSNRKSIDPTKIVYVYKSIFNPNTEYRVEHDFELNTFVFFRDAKKLGPIDSVFNELIISHHPYIFEEYIYFEPNEISVKEVECLFLKFNIIEHDIIVQGVYEICEGYEPQLYLYRSAGFGRLDQVYYGDGEILGPEDYGFGMELKSKRFQFKD